ncbi:hypothetical protein INT43_003388 [Umbelopsis isabellina]|uniref:Uncharacterized protein n=1 Tax=Mortierella isabellina TaxID=91625 RepID=A0A8H7PQN6_MORIS|nr:hypothetical protein INT43_003388 [Umbelopsis isabellina]
MHTKIISLAILLAAATLQAAPVLELGEVDDKMVVHALPVVPHGLKARGEPEDIQTRKTTCRNDICN